MKKRSQLIIKTLILMFLIIASVSISNMFGGIVHYFFYEVIYCIGISICIPIFFLYKEGNGDSSFLGIRKLRFVDYIIIIGFITFLVGGHLMKFKFPYLNYSLLPLSILPLIMTTFAEEFFFRGFLQIRFEKAFGAIPAILLSGLTFGLYHLGYPGFRNIKEITILVFVGIFFALAFKLAKNNLFVSYFVNLPNAYVTYLLKFELFPEVNFTSEASIVTILVIFIAVTIINIGVTYAKREAVIIIDRDDWNINEELK